MHPSTNRVYAEDAPRLTVAELSVFGISGAVEEHLGGVPYVVFSADGPADVSNVSGAYALFTVEDGGLLRPVPMRPLARFDDDLITIPKYPGKTNEQFTRLLLNVTVLAAGLPLESRLTVLDPVCGRGTTINQALMYGYDGIGLEIEGKDVDAYSAFLRAWLQRKRLKHRASMDHIRQNRKRIGRRLSVTIAGDQEVTVYHADTTRALDFLRPRCADVIVADLPYGVAHRLDRRNPLELLAAAIPEWVELVRPGGAVGISWNLRVAPRAEAAAVLAGAGLDVADTPDFAHRVDQTITRDILVARLP